MIYSVIIFCRFNLRFQLITQSLKKSTVDYQQFIGIDKQFFKVF